jgi:hypothetical protein
MTKEPSKLKIETESLIVNLDEKQALNSREAFSRNESGLLKSLNYKYNEDGTINWKSMVKPEFLVPNKDKFQVGTDFNAIDVTQLDDSQLLILLGGIKDIACIRGFTSVDYEVVTARQDYVAVKCNISWIPNYETGMLPVKFSALADAHFENTSGFGNKFLMAIAENRAFIRSVRNFLRINIVGQDEIDPKKKNEVIEESQPTNPSNVLNKVMSEVGLSFDIIKNKLIEEKDQEAELWKDISDIPKKRIFEIIERIKRKNKN